MRRDGEFRPVRCDGRVAAGRGRFVTIGGIIAACLLAGTPGCGPAPVRPEGLATGGTTLPLSGVYEASFSAPYLGTFKGKVIAEPTREGFRANTRPGAAWPLIGGLQEFLGPIFAPYLFPGGVILGWSSALPSEGKPGEGWIGPGGMRRYGVRTLMDTPEGPVRLLLPDGRAVALMTLAPDGGPGDHADFPQVAGRIEDAMRTRLFVQPVNGKSSPPAGLDAYLSQLHESAGIAQDDVEFAFGAAMAARNNLKFMPLPLRRLDPDAEAALRSWPQKDLATVQWSLDRETGIVTIKSEVFIDTVEVDEAMAAAIAASPVAIVIDLRSCQGVEVSALRVAAWLMDSSVDAGAFYGPGEAKPATEVQLAEAQDYDDAGGALDREGAIHLVLSPVERPFAGPVAVLTSRRTAGTAEALAAILQASGRAKIIGEQTAGRIVLSRPVDVGEGWMFRLPAAGWLPPDGVAVGPRGVEPDLRSSADAAPIRAAESLKGSGEGP